ncbi:MAG: hypothetical protein JNL82_35760 [Myxococcales bacterium]|nr:hypothetical protein [Myxococcales bacterium]
MTRAAPSWQDDPRARRRVVLFLVLVALAGVTIALSLLLLRAIQLEQHELRRLGLLAQTCEPAPAPLPPEPPPAPEPERAPESQPRGASAYIELGADIQPLMRLELEHVRTDGRLDRLRLGHPAVLPPSSVHLVSLWAPWCDPCKTLLPRLRDLFARRRDWARAVDFVPIQVQDATSPVEAFTAVAPLMPPTRAPLADRSHAGALVELLRDPSRALYSGNLPTTLLLDCNRRVRWAKEGDLTDADVADLERWIDRFTDQLRYDHPDCQRRWCGNGRCEPGEAARCEDDCGPPPAPPPRTCPADCLQCDEQLNCLARATTTGCGNRVCEPGENRRNCCLDCGCRSPHVCLPNVEKRLVCGPKPLKF